MSESYIIAIDLGTAYSGYAYNITPRNKDISPNVKRWGKEQNMDTPKTPTCILFDQDENFLHFGYEAKNAYINMQSSEAKKCYFFENFKMSLYGKKCVTKDLTIRSVNGQTMNALKVFTAALRFLKEDALKTISLNTNQKVFVASDFTWVLTVPAIWDDAAKQFMREAATQAGIVSGDNENKLLIALEPEAASVWCKKLPSSGFLSENHSRTALQQTPGTRYIVVDCGGGTVDITVHEVLKTGNLKELHKASGNNLGGQVVDKKFKEFLREIFCDGVWEEYEENHPAELQEIMYDFTIMKQVDQEAQFSCPYNLGNIAGKKKSIENYFHSVRDASWNGGKIKISQEKMRSFFEESLRGITANLRELLKNEFNIKYILLVGGYALSKVLRDRIEEQFGSQYEVLCPHLPQEAVVKGAVMFGRDQSVIASRKSAFTYGYGVAERFDASKHKEEKKFTNSEGDWCNDIFIKMVEVNETVGWDEIRDYTFYPLEKHQTRMRIRFFRTEHKNLKYTDDSGSEQIGNFTVAMPDTKGGLNRKVRMKAIFGHTEITATAIDLDSKSEAIVNIDFISNSSLTDSTR